MIGTLAFYLRYALRSLWRGGQRTLLAIVCVGFGVMSLVSMQLVASNFTAVVLNDPRAELGGDIVLSRSGVPLRATDLAQIEAMRAAGMFQSFTPLADGGAQVLRVDGGTADQIYILRSALGIDPAMYPLVGSVLMREPVGGILSEVLREEGSAVVTRDVADKFDVNVGAVIAIAARAGSVPVKLRVSGIVQSMPDRRGDIVMYNLKTAPHVAGWPDAITRIAVLWPAQSNGQDQSAWMEQLKQKGWNITTVEDVKNDSSRCQVSNLFGFMFKGAGILGLIVGGIGVATTLRVLLARRTLEIAMLKTLGYRQRDLVGLFAVEAVVLGLSGSVVSLGVAVMLSQQLVALLGRTGIMLMDWSADPGILLGGVLAGVVTAIVFGLEPIVVSSAVRPVAVLRQLPRQASQRAWHQRLRERGASIGLYALLTALFTSLCSAIMGSIPDGAAVVGGALAGLVVIGLVLSAALSLLVNIPLPRLRMAVLARNNLKRQKVRLIFPMLALFAGVFAIGFAAVTLFSADERMAERRLPHTGDNLVIYVNQADEEVTRTQLSQQGLSPARVGYLATIQLRSSDGMPVAGLDTIQGRSAADVAATIDLTGEPWSGASDRVYLPKYYEDRLPSNASYTLVVADGRERVVQVAGYYTTKAVSAVASIGGGVLANQALVWDLGATTTAAEVLIAVPANQLRTVTRALRQALPQATVLSVLDLDDFVNRLVQNLFVFVIAVAALALVAGAVLIANAVGLGMLERQREMGIFKAVGYTSRDVLKTVLIEHGLLGFLGGLSGMVGVVIAVEVINRVQPNAELVVEPALVAVMLLVSSLIAGGIAALVAWRPTHVRPLEVLRTE